MGLYKAWISRRQFASTVRIKLIFGADRTISLHLNVPSTGVFTLSLIFLGIQLIFFYDSPHYPSNDAKYKSFKGQTLPRTESLKITLDRYN